MTRFAEPEGDYIEHIRQTQYTKPLVKAQYRHEVVKAAEGLLRLFESMWTLNSFLSMITVITVIPSGWVTFWLPDQFGEDAFVSVAVGAGFMHIRIGAGLEDYSSVSVDYSSGIFTLYEEEFNYNLLQLLEKADVRHSQSNNK